MYGSLWEISKEEIMSSSKKKNLTPLERIGKKAEDEGPEAAIALADRYRKWRERKLNLPSPENETTS